MKKLFVLKDLHSNQAILDGIAFESKIEAKKERDKRNNELPENKDVPKEEKIMRYIVSRGVDHDKGPSRRSDFRILKRAKSKKKLKVKKEDKEE